VSAKLVGRGIRINTISPGPIATPVYGKLVMPADQVAQMGDGIRT
jgi:NAD(P)-dependent dehydrogenase (short-subunit alcohol dehydrogenase family)